MVRRNHTAGADPRQLAISLRVAGSSPDKMAGISSEDWSSKREQLEKQADGLARQLTIPDEDFQVPVTEALWFSQPMDRKGPVQQCAGPLDRSSQANART